jgi:phospholipase/carboxylesterase
MTLLLQLLFACSAPAAPPPDPFWDDHEVLVVGQPKGPVCTIVAIHGYGANPEGLKGLYEGLGHPVQVLLPRAPLTVHEKGWSWFSRLTTTPPEELAAQVAEQADRLAHGLASMPTPHPMRGKPIVTGFSQGGMLSFAAAVRHPDDFSASLPLSGFLPEPLFPDGRAGAVPIHAFHGEVDTVIPIAEARKGVEHLARAGWTVQLDPYPLTSHTVPPPMRKDYYAAIAEACGL